MPPFAGLAPDGFGVDGGAEPVFVMRLWNVGRGPAVLRDVRLRMHNKDVLRAPPRHVIVDASGVHDAVWTSVDVAAGQRDLRHTGTLHMIYAHPNGSLFETVSEVELYKRASQVPRRGVRAEGSSRR